MRPLSGETRDGREAASAPRAERRTPPAGMAAGTPGRSRLGWRLARLWRRRGVRRAVTTQAPALLALGLGALLASDPGTHALIADKAQALGEALTARPRFAVSRIEIEGASPGLEAQMREILLDAEGASSLQLHASELRARVEALGEVRQATVALQAPDALRIAVVERRPAMVWREDGTVRLIDATGATIVSIGGRAERPDLPLVVGDGAARAAREALAIFAAAAPLQDRLRGLVRVGERRWDVVLTQGMRIMLPAERPVEAMDQALALDRAHGLFARDVAAIDLRLPQRPTLRLGPDALEARALQAASGGKKGTGA